MDNCCIWPQRDTAGARKVDDHAPLSTKLRCCVGLEVIVESTGVKGRTFKHQNF